MSKKNNNLKVVNLEFNRDNMSPAQPVIISQNEESIQGNGKNNAFVYFLEMLKEGSPTHSSVVDRMCKYIMGSGVSIDGDNLSDKLINPTTTFSQFIEDIIYDSVMFGYFFVEVTYSEYGNPLYFYHVPVKNIQTNLLKSEYQYNPFGAMNTLGQKMYQPFEQHGSDPTIYMHIVGRLTVNQLYPTVNYISGRDSILTEMEIQSFNLRNITGNFTLQSIISMYLGNSLTDEQKDEFYDEIDELYHGTGGKQYMLEFLNSQDKKSEVTSVGGGDFSKNFEQILGSTKDGILTSHAVTNPLLFGVREAGSLSSASELNYAYDIWQNTDGSVWRKNILSAFVDLFAQTDNVEFRGEMTWTYNSLLDTVEDKASYMTLNEIRAMKGLEPLEGGDTIGNATAKFEIKNI